MKREMYKKYLVKCEVFKRDNFRCRNIVCKYPESQLTLHHVKWKKNGGDDKVGIFMCFKALIEFPNIKVVFFSREEIGYVGSAACDMSFFDNTTLVLQADRNGNSDWITNTNGSEVNGKEFRDKIAHLLDKYNYKPCSGVGTDVGKLKNRGLKVAAANLSCGYFEAHTDNEFIVLPDIQCAWMLMKDICNELGNEVQPHEDKTPYGAGRFYRGYNFHDEDWGGSFNTKAICVECGTFFNKGTGFMDLMCSLCYSSCVLSGMEPEQIQEFLEIYQPTISNSTKIKRGDEVVYKDSKNKTIMVVQMVQGQWIYVHNKGNSRSQFWIKSSEVERYIDISPNKNDKNKERGIDMTKEEIIKRYFYSDRVTNVKNGDILLTLGGSIVQCDGSETLKSFPLELQPSFTLDVSLASNGLFVFKSDKRVRMFINKFSNTAEGPSRYDKVSRLIYSLPSPFSV